MPSRFSVKFEVIDPGQGVWKTARVHVFEDDDAGAHQIGRYDRNHAGWCESTFAPFVQDGCWYALYAPDYTATRVMELPSCRDLGGKERHTNGFCPVDYYVPYDHPDVDKAGDAGRFGFVAGCIWGDDSSWKMQCLDLSEVSKGMLVRKESFGYLPMPHNVAGVIECQARTAVRATLGSTVRPPNSRWRSSATPGREESVADATAVASASGWLYPARSGPGAHESITPKRALGSVTIRGNRDVITGSKFMSHRSSLLEPLGLLTSIQVQ